MVEFSNEEKWSLLIEPKQNSTLAQLSGIQHDIIRFFLIVFTRNQGNTRLSDMKYLKIICPEASNVICYDLHTIIRLSSGCRNLHSKCKAI